MIIYVNRVSNKRVKLMFGCETALFAASINLALDIAHQYMLYVVVCLICTYMSQTALVDISVIYTYTIH